MTPEGYLKKQVKGILDVIPEMFYWMPVPTGFGIRGIPDFVGCYKGIFFGIETKAPGGEQTPWQERIQQRIERAGGYYLLAYTEDEVYALLGTIQDLHLRNQLARENFPSY